MKNMPAGIRATVEFGAGDVCPLTRLSKRADRPIYNRSTSVRPSDGDYSVTEFLTDVEDGDEIDGVRSVISYGSAHLYRRTHDEGVTCPCECLGLFGCPVERYFAQDGSLTLVFHADGYEQLQDVVGELRDRFPDVDIKRLVRSPTEGTTQDNVFVNRSKLTKRQFEVLQTAYEMGYFERPRQANATVVAESLDINPSTFTEHLAAAQTKLFEDILEDGR